MNEEDLKTLKKQWGDSDNLINDALNYITYLQKEVRINNDLIPYFKNRVKELKKDITNLQEEKIGLETKLRWLKNKNEKLQEENQKLVKVIKEIKFVFDNPENYFSDGCDCREIEDIINKLTKLKGGE